MPFFCYWLHSLLRWKECGRLGISGSFCGLSRVGSLVFPQPALCDSQERAVLQKMKIILMTRGTFLDIKYGSLFRNRNFWVSWIRIRIRNLFVRIRIWVRILLSSCKNSTHAIVEWVNAKRPPPPPREQCNG